MTAPSITLQAALVRAFCTARIPGDPHTRLVEDYETAADIAVRVAEAFIAEAEAGARADERERIIGLLRTEVTVQRLAAMEVPGRLAEEAAAEAAAYETAIGLLSARAKGLAMDVAGRPDVAVTRANRPAMHRRGLLT